MLDKDGGAKIIYYYFKTKFFSLSHYFLRYFMMCIVCNRFLGVMHMQALLACHVQLIAPGLMVNAEDS